MIILQSTNNIHKHKWAEIIEQEVSGEPMLLPSYLELFCEKGETAECALAEYKNGKIIYPYIKRLIPGSIDYFDLTSAYGYGGPRTIGTVTSTEKEEFWALFQHAIEKDRVVSEFIRFMLKRENETNYPGEIVDRGANVICSLDIDLNSQWMDLDYKVRKNVKKATSFNLKLVTDRGEHIDDFLKIYYATMDRREANERYYFKKSFYEKLNAGIKGHMVYFYALKDSEVISAELVLFGKENMYSYLGGTINEYYKMRPNDFLKWEIIKWGHEQNIKNFVLGGGYSDNDGIFRYKRSLAPNGVGRFYSGQRIINIEKYDELVCRRNESLVRKGGTAVNAKTESYFPLYRI